MRITAKLVSSLGKYSFGSKTRLKCQRLLVFRWDWFKIIICVINVETKKFAPRAGKMKGFPFHSGTPFTEA